MFGSPFKANLTPVYHERSQFVNTMQQVNPTDTQPTDNRDQTVVNNTVQEQIPTEQADTVSMTVEDKHFCNLVASGYSGTEAYRIAFPSKSKLKYSTIRAYASNLLTNYNIITEVESTKANKLRLARLAEDRISEVLTDMRPGKTVADVAMFVYDHANGKATQRTEVISKSVSVNIDLTGKVTDVQASERRQERTPV